MADSYGMAAVFETPEALLAATRRVREAGYRRIDTYTPFHLEDLPDALGYRETRLPWIVGITGTLALLGGLWAMWYIDVIYFPIPIGGRPLASWPAYALPVFELTVLASALAAVLGMLVSNRLPRLNHPVFETPGFGRVTQDRFFLVIFSDDPRYRTEEVRALLEEQEPETVVEVPV